MSAQAGQPARIHRYSVWQRTAERVHADVAQLVAHHLPNEGRVRSVVRSQTRHVLSGMASQATLSLAAQTPRAAVNAGGRGFQTENRGLAMLQTSFVRVVSARCCPARLIDPPL